MIASVIRFNDFQANLRTRELWKDGARVRLQDQPFQILAMMLERPGDIVTRDEIRGRLWPDGTRVDFEHSVNAAIKRLRTALGDTAESPRYIETLPRRGYRFLAPLAETPIAVVSVRAAAHAAPPRIIVLPFADLSRHEGTQDYFSDGLTEEMIAQLGRLLGTRVGVIARTSSMVLKGTSRTASEIGREFRAAYLMEGSVRRDGDRLRVTAQLIETEGETHLWAESYDRRLADVLAVQRDVAQAIARSLMIELLPGRAAPTAADTRNPAAYQAYLKGLFHWHRAGDAGVPEGLAYFDEAIALDPSFATAHAGRARCYVSRAENYRDVPRAALTMARASAERALALDPQEVEAHTVMAEVRRTLDRDSDGARAAYHLAFAANPSFHAAYRYYAAFLAARGDINGATAAADRACELDPVCLATTLGQAFVRYLAGSHEVVIRQCRDILEKDQSYLPAARLMATALTQTGRYTEAIAALTSQPEGRLDAVSTACLGYVLATAKDRKAAVAVRDRLARLGRGRFAPAYSVALLQTALGDHDAAFAALEAACEEHDPWLDTVAVDPRFEPLREDGRFAALVRRLGLTT